MVSREIISQCCEGKREGHKSLYNCCVAYVFSTVKRYIYNEEDQKDLVQESFAKVFLNIKSFNIKKGTFNTWIRKVTVNECLMHLRKTKKLSMLIPIEINDDIMPSEEIRFDSITRKDIENILVKMPDGYKVIFMLNVIDGYDHKEISELLGIQKETSRSQLARAKKWIRNHIINQKNKNAYGLF